MQYNRAGFIDLVKQRALQFGDFTLASGKKSTFYIDLRKLSLSAEGAVQIGLGILELLGDAPIDAIGGLTMGADPIVSAVLTIAGVQGRPLRGFLVRKEAKTHGSGNLIEGPIQTGDRVVVVEDTTTTGGSALKAVAAAQAAGAQVVQVVTVLDRLAGATQVFADEGIPFASLLSIRDLGIRPL